MVGDRVGTRVAVRMQDEGNVELVDAWGEIRHLAGTPRHDLEGEGVRARSAGEGVRTEARDQGVVAGGPGQDRAFVIRGADDAHHALLAVLTHKIAALSALAS